MADLKTLVVSRDDLEAIVRIVGIDQLMDELIARLTKALEEHDRSSGCVPVRRGFAENGESPSVLEWMPARAPGGHVTIKVVGYNPANPAVHRLPTIVSTLSLYDLHTGHLLALADGTFLTAMRTGAASAVATRMLASEHSRVLGIIGCGAQAVTQVHALSRVCQLQRILYFDIDQHPMESFPTRVAPFGIAAVAATPTEILRRADIVCTCTSVAPHAGPVFADGDHQRHLHINAIGSDLPGKTEVPRSLLARSFVVPDFLEQAAFEGECQQLSPGQVTVELADCFRGLSDQESLRDRLTVFDSTGFALEDRVAMEVLTHHAAALQLGAAVSLEMLPSDPKDPYSFTRRQGAIELHPPNYVALEPAVRTP